MTDKEFLALCRQKDDKGFDTIKEFINNKGVFKSIRGASGTTPLHIAARSNSVKVIQLFLDNGMNPMIKDKTNTTKNPIIVAIEVGSVDAVLTLLKSPKVKAPKTKGRHSEFSALGLNSTLKIISMTDIDRITKALVEAGFNIDIMDNQRRTLLTRGINNNHLDLIKIALKHGADINNSERIPLRFAFYQDNQNNEIIKYLIDNGADLVETSDDEWGRFNALHDAHIRDNTEMFEYLIKEYNALDNLDDETLDEILEHKEIEFIKYLWEIPKVYQFILDNNLEEAFPSDVREMFIF